jgi:hypothetical protein
MTSAASEAVEKVKAVLWHNANHMLGRNAYASRLPAAFCPFLINVDGKVIPHQFVVQDSEEGKIYHESVKKESLGANTSRKLSQLRGKKKLIQRLHEG